MKKFAVIGNPIAHSRSPALHQAFATQFGITLHYDKILAEEQSFAQVVQDFFAQDGVGLNITVPFKEHAFALCQQVSERGKIAKAINTLYVKDGKLCGDNTDGQGLVDALLAHGCDLLDKKVLILGAGGATRGVIYPLAQAGVTKIHIANRTVSRAEQLVNDIQPFVTAELQAMALADCGGHFDVVINATSASLSGDAMTLPADLHFDFAYEMAYGKPSTFLDLAIERGVPYADGYSMLVGQAIEAFAIWHGVRPTLADFLTNNNDR